ncbi:aminotransferase class V-fold PLP-dependent enzyme [Arachidicoccus terrestris]|uniref:aminotransferase class V-fold PLP-dependent enzyme n=1 Tax=Arachidicoccus terrestris TaxID=2875539 RepID=UPI001CC6F06F|nr:aminotransferase class V-fold PLP-dependent enzyme [Arachidicoccus terrestris]UAY57148.1 aminotransferase class V-fold PLP-dependent enzyme [Arachidicoccus terrestris]
MQPDSNGTIYLNTAGCGLISADSLKAGADVYNAFAVDSSTRSERWRETEDPAYRKTLAGFLEVDESRLGYIPNFSYAMNMVVQSLRGDERVLVYKNDYPSIIAPFVQNGFAVHTMDSEKGFSLRLETIAQIFTEQKIDILAIGHVQWQTGFKIDLSDLTALCKKHHVKLIVDATQSLGAIPIPMQKLDIDVLIASNYKWMNSGFGNGIIYFDPSFLAVYPPVVIGAASLEYAGQARSYEPGGLNIYGLALLNQAIREKKMFGASQIHAHNMRLTKTLLDGLAIHRDKIEIYGDYTIDNRASIVVLKDVINHHGSLGAFLAAAGIVVTNRGGTLRISMHFYNQPEEVGYLLQKIEDWLK